MTGPLFVSNVRAHVTPGPQLSPKASIVMPAKKMRRVSQRAAVIALAACTTLGASACDEPSAVPGDLALNLTIARPTVRLGDTVTVRIEARNTGTGRLRFRGAGEPCQGPYELLRNGQVLVWKGACAAALELPVMLDPGETHSAQFVLQFVPSADNWSQPIETGAYEIRAKSRTFAGDVATSVPRAIELVPAGVP
ncbi:MAG: hypothetical protein ACO1Q7_03240 [Gemmatimonas sp.]